MEAPEKPFVLPLNYRPTEYLDLAATDQASMDDCIPEHNAGYQLLLKMGWKRGIGLGSSGQGILWTAPATANDALPEYSLCSLKARSSRSDTNRYQNGYLGSWEGGRVRTVSRRLHGPKTALGYRKGGDRRRANEAGGVSLA
jgi:hypothetical protein